MNGIAVYALCDPQTMGVRYVGYSKRMPERRQGNQLLEKPTGKEKERQKSTQR